MTDRLPVVRKDGQNVQIPAGDGLLLRGALNEAPPVTLASAATVAIGAAAANTINISGTTTITSFDTIAAGAKRTLIFAGALTLTYNATKMKLLTSASITTAAGDTAEFESLGSGNWLMTDYVRANGTALVGSSFTGGTLTSALNEAPTPSKASAANLSFTPADLGNTFDISGTTTISDMGNACTRGTIRRLRFLASLQLTQGNLKLPSGANITTKEGDFAEFIQEGGFQWRCFNYTRADGTALVSSGSGPANTDALPEGTTNLYFTAARVLATTLAGFASAVGAVTAADTILAALGKLQGTKVDKVDGKGLSTNDYTTAEQTKLAGIAAGAQVNKVTSVASRTGDVVLTSSDVGLGNANNTSDADKPVSTAQQTALDAKAPIASPVFTGDLKINATVKGQAGSGVTGLTVAGGSVVTGYGTTFPSNTMLRSRGTEDSPSGVLLNDKIGEFAYQTYDSSGQIYTPFTIEAFTTEAHTNTGRGVQVNFASVRTGAATRSVALNISGTGIATFNAGVTTASGAPLVSGGPTRTGLYTLTTLPSASAYQNYLIIVTNATGGAKLCYSNGTSWMLINSTTVVS